MAVKNDHMKDEHVGYARTRWEPVKPDGGFSTNAYNGYHVRINGKTWICWCKFRYNYMLKLLVHLGVSVEHLMAGSKEVPESKCLEIAKALRKAKRYKIAMLGSDKDDYCLEGDIRFFEHCGGIKIHDWGPPNN